MNDQEKLIIRNSGVREFKTEEELVQRLKAGPWWHVQGTERKAVWLKHNKREEKFVRRVKAGRGMSYGFGDQSDEAHFMGGKCRGKPLSGFKHERNKIWVKL